MKLFGRNISKKALWVGGGVLASLALLVGYLFYKNRKEEKAFIESLKKDGAAWEDEETPIVVDKWANCNDNFPLKENSCGERVKVLQHWLKNIQREDIGPEGIDGKLGQKTLAALTRVTKRDNVSEEYWKKAGLYTIKL